MFWLSVANSEVDLYDLVWVWRDGTENVVVSVDIMPGDVPVVAPPYAWFDNLIGVLKSDWRVSDHMGPFEKRPAE